MDAVAIINLGLISEKTFVRDARDWRSSSVGTSLAESVFKV